MQPEEQEEQVQGWQLSQQEQGVQVQGSQVHAHGSQVHAHGSQVHGSHTGVQGQQFWQQFWPHSQVQSSVDSLRTANRLEIARMKLDEHLPDARYE